jgi:hypothetical protein
VAILTILFGSCILLDIIRSNIHWLRQPQSHISVVETIAPIVAVESTANQASLRLAVAEDRAEILEKALSMVQHYEQEKRSLRTESEGGDLLSEPCETVERQ